MKPEDHLEAWARRTLESLPLLPAPASLIPNILEQLREQALLPWYRRSWFFWPGPLRVLFVALSSGAVFGLVLALSYFPQASAWLGQLLDPASNLKFLGTIVAFLQKFLGANFLTYLAVGGLLLYLVCVALGSACYQIVMAQRRR